VWYIEKCEEAKDIRKDEDEEAQGIGKKDG
jgi:hypothetical protein